jgi:hypothetical protein
MTQSKTYKREVASLLLTVLLSLICLWVFFGNSLAGEAVKVLNLPIFTFAGAAFGMDSVVKQWNISNK